MGSIPRDMRRGVPKELGETRACTSTMRGRVPSLVTITTLPDTGCSWRDRKIADGLDLTINALYQNQNPYEEVVVNGAARLYISNKPGRHYILALGGGFRLDDAWYPMIGFQYNNWYISGAYDVTTSFFDIDTDGRGGPEVAVRYIFARPVPPTEFRKCPVY